MAQAIGVAGNAKLVEFAVSGGSTVNICMTEVLPVVAVIVTISAVLPPMSPPVTAKVAELDPAFTGTDAGTGAPTESEVVRETLKPVAAGPLSTSVPVVDTP